MTEDIMISKFRPTSLHEVLGQPHIVKRLKRYVSAKNMPHCLFKGGPGIGKTSSATAFFYELYGEDWEDNVLEMNASDERGIDKIRGKVQDFAKSMSINEVPFKIIFLDEADHLTTSAQATLRRVMEDFSHHNRFILSCNYSYKIITPIQDRCAIFRFKLLSNGDVRKGLNRVIKHNKIDISSESIKAISRASHGSMRKALNILEDATIGTSGKISANDVYDITGTFNRKKLGTLIHACKEQNVKEVNRIYHSLKIVDKMSVTEIIHEMIKYIDETPMPLDVKERLYYLLAEVEWRASQGANDWLQFRWMLSQIKNIKSND